ncbi:MAG: dihydroorotase [Lachnospirales bacterium]
MNYLIKNVITTENYKEQKINLLIENGKILQISTEEIKGEFNNIIDGNGYYILPGFLDLNCEVCEPGYDYKDDMKSISKCAIKSGFTAVTCNPNTDPVIDNKVVARYIRFLAKESATINIYPYGHMSKEGKGEEIAEIGEMIDGEIVGISDGNNSIKDNYLISNIFSYSNMFNIPVITYCEDKSISKEGMVNSGKVSVFTGLKGIPSTSEEVELAKNLLIAGNKNAKLHLTQITTEGSVNLIRLAKKRGFNVTCDTSPHYFTFTEDEVLNYDSKFKVRPPLRKKTDLKAILYGLADGTIDAISSGHKPENCETKEKAFENSSFGISSLETTFLVSYNTLVIDNKMPLQELVNKLAVNPYNLINIKNKGHIKEGYDADLFLFNPNKTTIVDPLKFETKAKYSMYDGLELKGAVEMTFVKGELVYSLSPL